MPRSLEPRCPKVKKVSSLPTFSNIRVTDTFFTVPVYDGRENFSLAKYWARKYQGDVKAGTTVCILFSAKQGKLSRETAPIAISGMIGIYLNVLGVVVLEEPSDAFCPDGSPDPGEVHGIDYLRRLSEVEVEPDEGDHDGVDGEVF